jgi:hypothetical protein
MLNRVRSWLGLTPALTRPTAIVHVYRDARRLCVAPLAQTKAGFYLAIEPVAVLEPDDREGFVAALASRMAAPMKHVPTPPRDSPAVLLRHTPYRRWTELERHMESWSIEATASGWKVLRYRRRKAGVGLEPDEGSAVELHGDPDSVAVSIVDLLWTATPLGRG